MREKIMKASQLFLLILCAGLNAYAGEKSNNAKSFSSEVVVLQSEDFVPTSATRVKTIEIDGSNNNLTYREILERAKRMAAESDANVVKINERIARSSGGPVDKVVATFYRSDNASAYENELSWKKNRKLSWDDFRGPIPADAEEVTAAATFCGIGFETNSISSSRKDLKIKVYNTFYTNHSWAKPEEMNDDVLAHEQGHFDLCELYTRKLRQQMSQVKVDVHNLKPVLRNVYEQLQAEYKRRQAAYEDETEHGVNLPEQRKWEQILVRELAGTERWADA
jgi:hypothetical protein